MRTKPPEQWTLPIKTDWMRQQMDHAPSRDYAFDIYNLVKDHLYENAVEIGAAWGISTLAILTARPEGHLLSVDKDPNVKALSEVKANKLDQRHSFICQSSDKFWDNNTTAFDLVYVDGSHLYKDCIIDLCKGWEWLQPGGLLIVDDILHEKNLKADPTNDYEMEFGVSYAVIELMVRKNITHCGTTERLWWTVK